MKFETVTVMQRKNIGNYEHIEITTTARLDEDEDFVSAAMTARTYVDAVLNMPLEAIKTKEEPKEIKEEVTAEAVKEKKTRAKKGKTEEVTAKEVITEENTLATGQEIPPVIEEVKAAVKYDRGLDAHKGMLSAHLTKTFADWKTKQAKDKIIAFNSSLHGKDFLDKDGNMLNSFKGLLSGFYA